MKATAASSKRMAGVSPTNGKRRNDPSVQVVTPPKVSRKANTDEFSPKNEEILASIAKSTETNHTRIRKKTAVSAKGAKAIAKCKSKAKKVAAARKGGRANKKPSKIPHKKGRGAISGTVKFNTPTPLKKKKKGKYGRRNVILGAALAATSPLFRRSLAVVERKWTSFDTKKYDGRRLDDSFRQDIGHQQQQQQIVANDTNRAAGAKEWTDSALLQLNASRGILPANSVSNEDGGKVSAGMNLTECIDAATSTIGAAAEEEDTTHIKNALHSIGAESNKKEDTSMLTEKIAALEKSLQESKEREEQLSADASGRISELESELQLKVATVTADYERKLDQMQKSLAKMEELLEEKRRRDEGTVTELGRVQAKPETATIAFVRQPSRLSDTDANAVNEVKSKLKHSEEVIGSKDDVAADIKKLLSATSNNIEPNSAAADAVREERKSEINELTSKSKLGDMVRAEDEIEEQPTEEKNEEVPVVTTEPQKKKRKLSAGLKNLGKYLNKVLQEDPDLLLL